MTFLFLLVGVSFAHPEQPTVKEPLSLEIEVAKYWNGPEKDSLREISSLHPIVLSWWLRDLDSTAGIQAESVSQLTLTNEPGSGFAAAIETTQPVDIEKVCAGFVPDGVEKQHGNQIYFANKEYALYVHGGKTVIVGSPEKMPAIIDRVAIQQAQPTAPASGPNVSVSLLRLQFQPKLLRESLPPQSTLPWLQSLLEAETARAIFLPADKLLVQFSFEFPNAERAAAGEPAVKEMLSQLHAYLELAEANIPMGLQNLARDQPGAEKLIPSFDSAIKAAKVGLTDTKVVQNDKVITAEVAIDTKRPVTDAVLLLSLLPRAAKE